MIAHALKGDGTRKKYIYRKVIIIEKVDPYISISYTNVRVFLNFPGVELHLCDIMFLFKLISVQEFSVSCWSLNYLTRSAEYSYTWALCLYIGRVPMWWKSRYWRLCFHICVDIVHNTPFIFNIFRRLTFPVWSNSWEYWIKPMKKVGTDF